MPTEPELARFDIRRTTRGEQDTEQADFRAAGLRDRMQLALDELDRCDDRRDYLESTAGPSTSQRGNDPAPKDLKVALECARATIDGLQQRVAELEAELDEAR